MNTRHAQYMLTILKEGSITAAARKLYVSQPSLSQTVRLVENSLGTPIFNRTTDPITLTYAGEKYMEAARQILTIHSNLEKEISEITHEDHGTIRLGIPVQRAMEVLPYILPRFKDRYPHVEIRVTEDGSSAIETMAREGNVDLACLTTSPKYEELEYIFVEAEELVLLTSRLSALAGRIPAGTPIDITEARNETFINIKPGHSVRDIQDRLFILKEMQPRVMFETVSIEVAKRTAIACGAVMICPRNYLDTTPQLLPHCVTYPLSGIENRRCFYICHRKDRYLTRFMKDFISMVTTREQTPGIPPCLDGQEEIPGGYPLNPESSGWSWDSGNSRWKS